MAKAKEKDLLFISHVHTEKAFAQYLGNLFQTHYRNAFEIFVSSHEKMGVQSGTSINTTVIENLKRCKIILVCCCSASIDKPWIHFEAGAGVVRGIPVVPVCYGGMQFGNLPSTLSGQSGLNMSDQDDIVKLNGAIATTFNLGIAELDDKNIQKLISISESNKSGINTDLQNKTSRELIKGLLSFSFFEFTRWFSLVFFNGSDFTTEHLNAALTDKSLRTKHMTRFFTSDHTDMKNDILSYKFAPGVQLSFPDIFCNFIEQLKGDMKLAVQIIKDSDVEITKKLIRFITYYKPRENYNIISITPESYRHKLSEAIVRYQGLYSEDDCYESRLSTVMGNLYDDVFSAMKDIIEFRDEL